MAEQIVSPDSDKNMEELFRVLKDSSLVNSRPLKQRNLPPSFWQQPQKPSHSREGSSDSTSFVGRGIPAGLHIVHGRSHSSPAQLPNTMSVPAPAPLHQKQASMGDFIDACAAVENQRPMPAGWDMAKSHDGTPYFINHVTKTTTWVDPRKSLSNSSLSQLSLSATSPSPGSLSPATSNPRLAPGPPANTSPLQQSLAPAQVLQPLQALPQALPQGLPQALPQGLPQGLPQALPQALPPGLPLGWEQASTPDGEIYYINHNNRNTSWFDPRLNNLAPAGKVSKPTLSPHHSHGSLASPQHPSMSPQHPGGAMSPQHPSLSSPQHPSLSSPQHPHPHQSPQAGTPQQQRSPAVSPPQPGSRNNSQPNHQVHNQLLLLKQERARLLQRQEEIKQQEQLLQDLSVGPVGLPVLPVLSADLGGISVDPFLGQASTMDAHARQNSGDSGLGGMGTNYSLPRTPEDFLSNVDEMDTNEGVGHKLGNLPHTDFNLNDLPPHVEVGNLGDNSNDATAMDSDDLVPSLQEDISNALLGEMDVSKMENILTWL